MKISNWRKNLAKALVGCGLLAPSAAATAANLNQNLVVNGGFESVNASYSSNYYAPLINGWSYVYQPGFAYSHNGSLGGYSNPVPDFANGSPLAAGGNWYFTPTAGNNDSFASAIFQDIDVSTGATATAIAAGTAQYNLSGFFNTYQNFAGRAFVQADFYDAQQAVAGTAQIVTPAGTNLNVWTQYTKTGVIPAGTVLVQISAWGESPGGTPDGYQDNLDFRIIAGSTGFMADFDGNGAVDGADLLRWQRGNGALSGAAKAQGDANGNGAVNSADLAIWQSQFGGGGAVIAATAVPEPTTAAVAIVAGWSAAALRRRQSAL